jgi:hypothetical protein
MLIQNYNALSYFTCKVHRYTPDLIKPNLKMGIGNWELGIGEASFHPVVLAIASNRSIDYFSGILQQ